MFRDLRHWFVRIFLFQTSIPYVLSKSILDELTETGYFPPKSSELALKWIYFRVWSKIIYLSIYNNLWIILSKTLKINVHTNIFWHVICLSMNVIKFKQKFTQKTSWRLTKIYKILNINSSEYFLNKRCLEVEFSFSCSSHKLCAYVTRFTATK